VSSVFRNHCDVFRLEKAVPWFQVTIQKIGNFLSGAWFPILFNARKMCSRKRRLEFGTFFIGTVRIFWGPLLLSGLGRILEKVKAVTLVML
jgi:hypothetical protein